MNKVQGKILEIYKEIKKICEKENIKYFAIGGTAIGTVRHRGFIPWDDDIDIAMPYEDYLRFCKVADKYLPNNYRLIISVNERNRTILFNKVHDINTTFIENYEMRYPSLYKGVYVDIMPLFGTTYENYKSFNKKRKIYQFLHNKKNTFFSQNNTLMGKISWIMLLPVNIFVNYNFWSKKWEKLCAKSSFNSSDITGYFWVLEKMKKDYLDVSLFSSFVEMPFEDTTMRLPIGYDEMLKDTFGDYMVIPPIEKRANHNSGVIDINTPYSIYKERFNKEKYND